MGRPHFGDAAITEIHPCGGWFGHAVVIVDAPDASTEASRSSARHLRALSDGVMRPKRSFLRPALVVVGTLAFPVLAVSLVAGEAPIIGIVVSGLLLYLVVVLLMPSLSAGADLRSRSDCLVVSRGHVRRQDASPQQQARGGEDDDDDDGRDRRR